MKNVLYILLTLLLVSCSPGELIDKKKSDSYFITSAGTINYSPQGNWFEIGIEKCDADKKSFKILSNSIAKDKNHIFYCGIKQEHVDFQTFYIEKEIPKDKKYAYTEDFQKLVPIVGVDAKTFEYLNFDTLNHSWSKDKNHYYIDYKKINVDYSTFTFLNRRFSKDKDSLYADLNSWKFITVKENTNDISVINCEYIKDKSTLYYISTLSKVELLTNHFETFKTIRIVDNDVVCINDKVIVRGVQFKTKTVDANSFKLFRPNQIDYYSKDKNHVYYEQNVIEQANPKTYLPLEFGYGKDDKHVYHETKLLKGVDAKSFKETSENSTIYGDKFGNNFDWKGKKL